MAVVNADLQQTWKHHMQYSLVFFATQAMPNAACETPLANLAACRQMQAPGNTCPAVLIHA
jgi:hypothetical protein